MDKKALPLAAMEKILKAHGADRVADEAKVELRDYLENFANQIAQDAIRFSLHSGRKTIKSEDIKLAVRK